MFADWLQRIFWRERISRGLTYVLIASFLAFVQSISGSVPAAQASVTTILDGLDTCTYNTYPAYYSSPIYGPTVRAGTTTTIKALNVRYYSPNSSYVQNTYITAYEVNTSSGGSSSWTLTGTPSQFTYSSLSAGTARYTGSLNVTAGKVYAFLIRTSNTSQFVSWYYCAQANVGSNSWTFGKDTSDSNNFVWFTGNSSGASSISGGYSFSRPDHIAFSVEVEDGVSITTPSAQSGTTNSAFTSLTLSTSGATGTKTFSVDSGSLPPGLSLNTSTGVVSGTPTFAGTFTAAFKVADSGTGTNATTSNVTFTISGSTGLSLLFRSTNERLTADADYFGNSSLTASNATTGLICHSSVVSTMNLDYDYGPSVGGDCASNAYITVYARGSITAPVTGEVEFCTYNDDGMKVVVNAITLVNDTTDHGVSTGDCNFTGTMYMYSGNVYPIEMWGHNGNGGGQMTLKWKYSGISSYTVVPSSNLSTTFPSNLAPQVKSVNSSTANGSYYLNDQITIQVTFDDLITVSGTPTLQLETGSADTSATYTSGSGTNVLTFTYTVASTDVSSDLDYKATTSLANSGGGFMRSPGGVNATLTLPTPGAANSLGSNKALVIDGSSPTISSVTSSTANGTYKVGDSISIQITFSSSVTVNTSGGTPTLTLETGATDRNASYVSGSGTNTLTFTYTVQSGDTSSDLNYSSLSALLLNGGTIRNSGSVNASLTLPSLTGSSSLAGAKAIVIDGVGPSLSSSTPTDGASGVLANSNLVLNFGEAISAGTGNISIYKADGTLVEAFNVATSSRLTFSSTSVTIDPTSNLASNTSYYINVDSTSIRDANLNNFAGISDSTTLNFTTYVTPVPTISSQPSNFTRTAGQSVTFSVSASASSPSSLTYQWLKDGVAISGATTTTYSISSVTSASAGTYQLVVTNTYQGGVATTTTSSSNGVLTVVSAPSVPREVTFSNNGLGAGTLRLTWDAPSTDGGSQITAYEYRYSLADVDSWSSWIQTDTRTVTIDGLANQKSYKAQVRAKNAYGVSASTQTQAAVSTTGDVATTLGAPTITSINADTSLGSRLTVNFTSPTVNGIVNAITSYQYSTDNGSSWKTATWTAGTSSFVITTPSNSTSALANGTIYTVLLRAVNAAGSGTSSSGVTGTPSKAPGSPTSLSLALPSSNAAGSIVATFNAPTDTGGLTLSYEYRIKLNSSNTWGNWTSGGSSSPFSITGITNGQTYDVQVRAKNSSGESPESNTATLNTVLATGPTITTQPTNKTLTVDQTTGATLTVAATGGAGETLSYQWYKNGSAITGATSATLTITNKAVTGDAGTYYAIVTASKSGTSANVSAKIDAMGPSNSICNAPNNQTFYYANRFYAGTADTIREFQIQIAAGTNATILAASKIRFYSSTNSSGSGTFYNSWAGAYPQPNESARVIGTDFTYVSTTNNIATFRGTAAIPSVGHYWWAFINNSTTSVSFCNSNSTETYTNGWYLYKEGTSWIWFGSFRQNIDSGKFAWYTHPNIRIFTSTTTTTSSLETRSDSVTVTVNPVPTITTSTVPGATKGSAYSTTLANSGGTGPFTWTLANGSSLPQGLSLSTSGVISGTPTATEASSASSSSSSSAGALKNGNFSASFANTASDGWWRAATRGGQTVINTVGKTLQFSFGSPACSTQSTVAMSEVRQQVTVATAGTVTFKVKVVNDIWNRIGFAYSNPCYDPYQVTMTRSGVAAAGKPTSVDTGRRIPNATTHQYAQEHEVTLTFETTQANEVVTISLFGLDAGYWAGNYGPVFKDARLETPGGSSGASSSSGTTTFTVEITDANGIKSTKTLTFAVASDISITTKTLGSANRGSSYTQALVATGGSGSLTWTVSNGTLPTGLTLNSSGSISGTVGTTAASSTFTVSVTDANNAVVTQTYTLNVLSGVPAAPSSLTVGTVASATLPLTWTAPTDNGGSAITGYVVSYSSGKGAGDDGEEGEEDKGSVLVNATGLTFPYSLTGLKNGRSYTVTVAAKNANATSVASNSVSAVPAKAAGAPQQLSMVLANGGITFRWKKPQDSGGLKIASYAVQCRNTANADTEANWKAITNRQDTDSNGQISLVLDATSTEIAVTQGQSYVCRVRANSAIGGVSYTGAWATASSALVFSTVPTSPNITIVDTTTASTKISVTFTQSSSDGGSQITSYIATATKSQSNSDDDEGNKRSCNVNRPNSGWGAGAQTCQITGIPKKGAFSVEVVAVNAVGKSVADTETVTIVGNTQILTYPDNSNNPGYTYNKVVTDADFPINVKSNSGLKLKYSIDNNDICTITGKGLIKVKKVGSCRITITQSGKADDDDDDDSNNKTDSDWEPITGTSQYVDVNIVGSTPSNPSWTSVTPGSSKLTATWKAPTGKNNQVTSYKLEWTTDTNAVTWSASDSLTVASNVLTSDITGLTNGTAYRVRVTAINSGASSSAILMPGSFTPASAPSKPTLGSILSYPDTSTVTVNWSAPASNGAAITGYTATATATGQTTLTCSTGGSATSCSITGVKNKVTYSITLTARNSIGSSEASDPSSVLVSGVSQIISLNTTPAGTGWSVGDPDLQLDASTDSGLPLQYSVQSSSICTISTGGLVHFVSDGTCRVYIDQDGTNSATGGGSATKYSAASQYGPIELVISPAKPSAPTLTSVANSANGLVITWTAPSKGGGTMTYTVTGAASGKSNETCSTTALTCTIQVASKGTRYSFTAVANNGIDTSTASTAMFGTWLVVPSAPNTSSTPSAPSTTDGKALNIYWTKSTDNGGILILAYTVTAANATYGNKTCVVTRTSTRDETGYSCTISGLRAGATYAITVTARNVIGNSSDLSIGSLTPGLTQTISLGENTSTSISKTFGDADFALNATIDSGNTPSFTTSSSACSVSSTGLVHILTVGSCVVTVSHPGATDSADSQYKAATSVTITITIANGTPSKATITQVSPTNSGLIVRFTAPSSTGGSTLSYVVRAVNGGTTVNCSAGGSDTCTVTGLVNGTEYQVTVIATNAGSNSSTSDAVSGIPYSNSRAPMPLTANGGIRQAELTWQQPAQYDGSLYRYKLLYRIAGSGSAFTELEVETSTVTSTISGLANNTRYEFQARAVVIDNSNVTALGDLTSSVFATTYALPGSPLNPASTSTYVTASGTSTAAVSWQPPTSNGGSAIIDYTVTASGGPSAGPCTTSSLTCNITGLTPGVSYTFSVTARTSVGTGSAGTIAHTTIAPASAPGSVALTLGSDSGTVTVNWSAPSSNGGTPITSYVVTVYTEAGTAQSFGCTVSAPSTSCVITGLPYKTSYKIAVAAVTGAGTGTYSAFTSPFTLSKDQTITFAEIDLQSFNVKTLTLEATTDSGLPITYTSGDATICSISGSTLTFQKIGNCSVTASQAGDSTYNAAGSVTRSFVIQAIDPEAVTLLQVAPGASKLTVSWSTATQLGGSTLKHYVVSWAKQTDFSDEQTLTTNSNTNVEITGLDAGAAYIVRIAVVTNDGSNPSEWSNRLSAKTFGAPAATDKPTVSTSAAGVVTVTWTNVSSADAGGTPITGYRVDAVVSSTSASTTFFCTAAASTCDVSGLSGSTYYKFKVTAINAVGSTESVLSDEIRPGQSQTITFENISTSHLAGNIKLAATTSSGLPISYSVVSQSPTNAESATWGSGRNVCVVDTAGNLTVDVGGTCVIAANQDGTDNGTETSYLPATEVRATITVAIDKPSLIAELTLTAGNQKIEATWTAPDVDGGAPITDYILTWFVKGNRHVDLTVGGTTAVTSSDGSYGRVVLAASSFTSTTMSREITGLTNGVTYSVRVQAKNSAGLGPEQ